MDPQLINDATRLLGGTLGVAVLPIQPGPFGLSKNDQAEVVALLETPA